MSSARPLGGSLDGRSARPRRSDTARDAVPFTARRANASTSRPSLAVPMGTCKCQWARARFGGPSHRARSPSRPGARGLPVDRVAPFALSQPRHEHDTRGDLPCDGFEQIGAARGSRPGDDPWSRCSVPSSATLRIASAAAARAFPPARPGTMIGRMSGPDCARAAGSECPKDAATPGDNPVDHLGVSWGGPGADSVDGNLALEHVVFLQPTTSCGL
jgi:hypothetical protein